MTTTDAIHRAILAADLTRSERNHLLSRWGFTGSGEEVSLSDAARSNGITVPAMRRIEMRAWNKVRPLV